MLKKRFWIFIIVVSLLFCFSQSAYAKQSVLERIEEEFMLENTELRSQEGLTETEFRVELTKLLAEYDQKISQSPAAALEYLSKGQANTSENQKNAKQYMEYQAGKLDLDQYYADSQGISVDKLSIKPNYTFSDPIPLVEETYLLAAGKGQIKPEYLIEYVAAWIFVGYANEVPYGVFQVVCSKGAYVLNTVFPSPKQAAAYELLLDIPGCYTTSVVSDSEIWYYQMLTEKIEKVAYRKVENPKEEITVVADSDIPVYFKAKKLASDANIQLQIDNPYQMVAGIGNEVMLTYQDTWNRAYYELYIRPYLISVVAVLALGAAVLIVIRRRKQKKA